MPILLSHRSFQYIYENDVNLQIITHHSYVRVDMHIPMPTSFNHFHIFDIVHTTVLVTLLTHSLKLAYPNFSLNKTQLFLI